ncbi:MAG: Cys-tRNA(Pro) deacylase [Firmicutes bacterium]|nr:Cys-tRNA(Pro) deacylase [Bacillota bacterium]
MAFKTNAMRTLDQKKLLHKTYELGNTEAVSGVEAARLMNADPAKVFKTLVTVGASKQHYVFVIPAAGELDLKKAAKAAKEKNIEMIKSKELLPLTGYVHGGCSPIGMKKLFPTFVDESAMGLETFIFSAGKIGYQIEMAPEDLRKVVPFTYSDLTV